MRCLVPSSNLRWTSELFTDETVPVTVELAVVLAPLAPSPAPPTSLAVTRIPLANFSPSTSTVRSRMFDTTLLSPAPGCGLRLDRPPRVACTGVVRPTCRATVAKPVGDPGDAIFGVGVLEARRFRFEALALDASVAGARSIARSISVVAPHWCASRAMACRSPSKSSSSACLSSTKETGLTPRLAARLRPPALAGFSPRPGSEAAAEASTEARVSSPSSSSSPSPRRALLRRERVGALVLPPSLCISSAVTFFETSWPMRSLIRDSETS
mmetsp:Transcript_30216/g.67707  ORF Transcript_30216/g.67707 Transcript_30216/m.67707 type:complete len:270 (-) Transcript_30216:237-1046(-)